MGIQDGNVLVEKKNGYRSEKCSRWFELTSALRFHANLAQKMKSPTEFWFLNRKHPIVVGGEDDAGLTQLENAFKLVSLFAEMRHHSNKL